MFIYTLARMHAYFHTHTYTDMRTHSLYIDTHAPTDSHTHTHTERDTHTHAHSRFLRHIDIHTYIVLGRSRSGTGVAGGGTGLIGRHSGGCNIGRRAGVGDVLCG